MLSRDQALLAYTLVLNNALEETVGVLMDVASGGSGAPGRTDST